MYVMYVMYVCMYVGVYVPRMYTYAFMYVYVCMYMYGISDLLKYGC
jgi:hypothetical protein